MVIVLVSRIKIAQLQNIPMESYWDKISLEFVLFGKALFQKARFKEEVFFEL